MAAMPKVWCEEPLRWSDANPAARSVMATVHATLAAKHDCGPFDGGCVAFALALQRLHGGEIHVLVGRTLWNARSAAVAAVAQHAVLRLPDGRFVDADTCGDILDVIQSFSHAECLGRFDCTGVRPLGLDDLVDAPRDARVVAKIVALLAGVSFVRTISDPDEGEPLGAPAS